MSQICKFGKYTKTQTRVVADIDQSYISAKMPVTWAMNDGAFRRLARNIKAKISTTQKHDSLASLSG